MCWQCKSGGKHHDGVRGKREWSGVRVGAPSDQRCLPRLGFRGFRPFRVLMTPVQYTYISHVCRGKNKSGSRVDALSSL